ncbi:MAG: HD-GYP domain-containing protein [Clostridia bacterium]|nr:HD-GYP domain-containing protein [Clostridia bacterium]
MILYLYNKLLGKGVYHEVIDCLVAALEAKDAYTSGHSSKVADMTCELAKVLGIKGSLLEDIHLAAHLHDIGKIGIPENILNKRGKLLPHELAQIRRHSEIGYNILIKSEGLRNIAQIVLHHHERWDGKGYPQGLKEDKIPLGSRIIAVADAMDAMISDRPYRAAMDWETCKKEVLENKSLQFDPVVVEAAVVLFPRWYKQFFKENDKKAQTF